MINDLTEGQKLLADNMSEISERCYSAGWMENLEYVLWDAVLSGPRNFGHGIITQDNVDQLMRLSNEVSCWIIFDNDKDEIAIPMDKWKAKFEIDVRRNPAILYKK